MDNKCLVLFLHRSDMIWSAAFRSCSQHTVDYTLGARKCSIEGHIFAYQGDSGGFGWSVADVNWRSTKEINNHTPSSLWWCSLRGLTQGEDRMKYEHVHFRDWGSRWSQMERRRALPRPGSVSPLSCYHPVSWSLPYPPLPALYHAVVDQNSGTLIQKIPFLL